MNRSTIALASLFVLLGARSAGAHLVSSGFGPFYDGILHLVISPDDLLGVLGLALLAGLRGKPTGQLVMLVLPAAWMVGAVAGLGSAAPVALPAASALSFLVVGALVAADLRIPRGGVAALAIGFGLFHGYLNGTAAAQANLGPVGVSGIAATVFVVIAALAAFTVSLRRVAARTAVRVAGSWIAAVGMLMTGWALH